MKFSISSARNAAANGDYGESVLNYLTVLPTVTAEQRQDYLAEFCSVLQHFISSEPGICKDKKSTFSLSRQLFPGEFDVLAISVQFLYYTGVFYCKLRENLVPVGEAGRRVDGIRLQRMPWRGPGLY